MSFPRLGGRASRRGKLVDGVKSVTRRDIAAMLDQYDLVWHW